MGVVVGLTLNELSPIIKKASKSVAFQWPGVIEADDVEQSIYLHLLERPNSVEKIGEMDGKAQYRAIVGIGHQIASGERTEYDHFKGSYRYSVAEVKDLLKKGILTHAPYLFSAERADLEEAFQSIPPQYADAISARYVYEQFPSCKQEENALGRGLTALANGMNKVHRTRYSERDDGPGTREVMSEAEARTVSRHQYSGEEPEWDS